MNDPDTLTAADNQNNPDNPGKSVPFVIEHGQMDVAKGGHFTPVARLVVQSALRTSGLLAALPDREAKSLLLLLTFLTANGRIEPTTGQIADALRLPICAVRSRMGKLTAFRWQGERIVRQGFKESGLDGYRLSRSILAEREAPGIPVRTEDSRLLFSSSHDAVIAHSRTVYGRSRSEVEAEVARQIGIVGQRETVSLSPEEADIRRQLRELGVSSIQADRLVAEQPLAVIREQLTWLPDRAARSPARYIIRAIEGRYAPPPRIRLERAIAEAEADEA